MTSLEIPDNLMRLKEIPMASFIDHVRGYRNVNVQDQPLSFWSYVIIIFSTVIALGVIIFVYRKYLRNKLSVDCQRRLANWCNDENVVMGPAMVEEKRLASSSTDEVVSHTLGRRNSSTPNRTSEEAMLVASLQGTSSNVQHVAYA